MQGSAGVGPDEDPGPPERAGKGSWIIFAVALVAIAVVVAVYARRRAHDVRLFAHAEDCEKDLALAWSAERTFFEQHHRYTDSRFELGLAPRPHMALVLGRPLDGGTAESFVVLPTDASVSAPQVLSASSDADQPDAGITPGLSGVCPACYVSLLCVGQLDEDPELDVWSLSSELRSGVGTMPYRYAGTPYHVVSDLQ